ncbi:MAG: ATP-binding protein [Candidatus Aquicultorales bacterium]
MEAKTEAADRVAFKVPAGKEYSTLLRLAVVGISNRLGFNLDEIEDIKLGVDEAFTIAVNTPDHDEFEIAFYLYPDRLEMVVENLAAGKASEQELYQKFGFSLLHSVMDMVDWETSDSERLRMVKLKK